MAEVDEIIKREKIIIENAVKQAIKEYDKEQKTKRKKTAFHNTRLLMKKYNEIKNHVDGAISEEEQLLENENEYDEYTQEDRIYIASIRKSKLRSRMILCHIDAALNYVNDKHEKEGDSEKYKSFKMSFFESISYDDIAIKLNCSSITARRWANEIIDEVSIQLFGVDGIKL